MIFAMSMDNQIDRLLSMPILAAVQATVALVWLVATVAGAIVNAVSENATLLAKFAAIVAGAWLVASVPTIGIGLALVAAYAVAAKPR